MPEADTFLQNVITELFSPMYQLAVGITILYFLYGVARYVIDLNTSNAERQAGGRRHLLYGMLGLFIVLSVGGIFKMLDGVFGGLFK
jgi:hypothetical protein